MNENITYYIDEESGLPVTSHSGEHFIWFINNKVKQIKDYDAYLELNEEEKEGIISWYIVEYIPR